MECCEQLTQPSFQQGPLPRGPARQQPSSTHTGRGKMYLLAAISPPDKQAGLGVTTLRGTRALARVAHHHTLLLPEPSPPAQSIRAGETVAPMKKELLPMNLNSHKKEQSLFLFSLEPQKDWGGEARGLCDR